MNKFSANKTIKNLSKAKMISISPLEMKVTTKNGLSKKFIAINEVLYLDKVDKPLRFKFFLEKSI